MAHARATVATVSIVEQAFAKYDQTGKGFLTKTEFKCAFIFLTGMKPSKRDMDVVKDFIEQN